MKAACCLKTKLSPTSVTQRFFVTSQQQQTLCCLQRRAGRHWHRAEGSTHSLRPDRRQRRNGGPARGREAPALAGRLRLRRQGGQVLQPARGRDHWPHKGGQAGPAGRIWRRVAAHDGRVRGHGGAQGRPSHAWGRHGWNGGHGRNGRHDVIAAWTRYRKNCPSPPAKTCTSWQTKYPPNSRHCWQDVIWVRLTICKRIRFHDPATICRYSPHLLLTFTAFLYFRVLLFSYCQTGC